MELSEKKVQIMEAAERLFAEKGFAGTSVRDIAEAANVNLAMISYYFGSKEKLMEVLFSHRGSYMRMHLENIVHNEDLTPLQKMEKLIDNYVERIFSKQCFHKVMLREQMDDNTGPIAEQIYQLKQTNHTLIKQIFLEGQKKGDFRKGVDISFLMYTLVGTTSQALTTQQYYRVLHNQQEMPNDEFEKGLKKKLSTYLKTLFKAILTYEG